MSDASRYRILRQLGAGGMGEVYLAEDTQLERQVAIKRLPPALTSDEKARKRLLREARAAAKLDHPNICAIYEVVEEGDESSIVMQLVEGETLAEHARRRPPTLLQALDIAAQVADALALAHARGIVHRDIKPQNLMIGAHGHVKVMDFGLARPLEQPGPDAATATGSLLTAAGQVVGTVPYMSPEQARGDPLDGRSDLFSLGCVLYELIAGRHPFAAESTAETLSAILTREPPPLARYASDVPAEAERIVAKTLAKDCEERYQSAGDLMVDLRRLRHELEVGGESLRSAPVVTAPGARPRRRRSALVAVALTCVAALALAAFGLRWLARGARESAESATPAASAPKPLAVLPFRLLTPSGTHDYLELGIADALITRLSNLSQLTVRPTSEVLKYGAANQDLGIAARELAVDLVLSGGVQRDGDRVRVTVQLLDAKAHRALWARQFDEQFTDLFTVEDSISQQVAQALTLQLSAGEQQRLTRHTTENPEAYASYLEGRSATFQYTPDGFAKAVAHLERAIALDPSYALAYAGLADAYTSVSGVSMAPAEALAKAKTAATKALALDEDLAEARAALGHAKFHGFDWSGADDLQRAVDLNPNSLPALLWLGECWLFRDPARAIPILRRAEELDPLSIVPHWFLSGAYLFLRQPAQAVREAQKIVESDPDNPLGNELLALVYAAQREPEKAVAAIRKASASGAPAEFAAYVYAASGRPDEARREIAALEQLSRTRYVSSYRIAVAYAALGEKDRAFAWLERGFAAGDEFLVAMKFDPAMDPLRSDPRYASLLRRIGLGS